MAGFIVDGRLKYFSRIINSEGTVNLLLVSSSQTYLDLLSHNVYLIREVQREKRCYNLKVHTCKTIKDVIQFMPPDFNVDFIVFILDALNANCLIEVEDNILLLDPSFSREKICLVNPDPNYHKSIISPQEIWDFATQHQFNLINGKVMNETRMSNLSKRILNLVEASCGILNGIPMVDVV